MEKEGNTIRNHPVLWEFLQQHDCEIVKAHLAFRVFMNFAEVRSWRDVNLHYCEELRTPFVTGRPTLGADLEAAVAITVEDTLTHQQIQAFFSALCVEVKNFDRIILAICASDSSIVFYRLLKDIVKPEPPEVSEARKQKQQQKAARKKLKLPEYIETTSKSLMVQHQHASP